MQIEGIDEIDNKILEIIKDNSLHPTKGVKYDPEKLLGDIHRQQKKTA